jgi:hypothetical protein
VRGRPTTVTIYLSEPDEQCLLRCAKDVNASIPALIARIVRDHLDTARAGEGP